MLIEGGCHCGNIRFSLSWDPDPAEISARACSCTFCTQHGAAWTSRPKSRLDIRIKNDADVSRYAFATESAHFLVCAKCGGVPVVTSEIDGRRYAVVNVNTFTNFPRDKIRVSAMDVLNESTSERLSRRARNWIGDVRIVSSDD